MKTKIKTRTTLIIAAIMVLTLAACNTPAPVGQEAVFHAGKNNPGPFSKAVQAGDFVYLSGMLGTGSDGTLDPDFNTQSKQVMENIKAVLGEHGLGMKDVVKATVMIKDMSKWADFNVIYRSYFEEGRFPARSAFGAAALALGAEIEVEVIAYKPAGTK